MPEFIVSTTSSLEGYEIKSYLGTVSSNIVTGTGFFSDLAASFSDIFGGRSQSYQKQLHSIYEEVEKTIVTKAKRIGANAVIGFKVDFDEISGKAKQMLMVSALGTAVFIEGNSDKKNSYTKSFLSSDKLNEKLQIDGILSKIEDDYNNITDSQWEVLIKYKELRTITPLITAIKNNPSDESLNERARDFFLSLPAEELKKIIYLNLDNDFDFFPYALSLITETDLLDIDYVIKMLDNTDLEIKKAALHLAKTEKDSYEEEDINKLEYLIKKINSAFPDLSTVEIKKGLTGSKEKWKCHFCDYYNNIELKSCLNCNLTRNGFKPDDLEPESVISLIKREIKILREHFNRN